VPDQGEDAGRRGLAEFWRELPLPAYIVDSGQGLYVANQALADVFGYPGLDQAQAALAADFWPTHFSPEAVGGFLNLLSRQGRVDNWPLTGETLDGRPLSLEVTAWGSLRTAHGPQQAVKAVFMAPGEIRDAQALRGKALLAAGQAEKAKNEFLANINHELRTPLNIVIGMLNMALEDETVSGDLKGNLALAKDGADRLFGILNDLIVLSNLEGGRLVSDIMRFSPGMLLGNLARQLGSQAREKGVGLRQESDSHRDDILEGGYNFIVLALEKLLHNAIKFADEGRGEAVVRALVEKRADGPWLALTVQDNGPGLGEDILASQELFHQGDGSMIRKHGGLGLGLRLARNLATALGGRLGLANRPGGGAEFSFSVPVKMLEEA
jgi:signal transduction histidine kinase